MAIQYKYYRNTNETGVSVTGGLTIAYRIDDDSISYGYAICSDKDQFNKKIGKEVATFRLADEPTVFDEDEILHLFARVSRETLRGLNKTAVLNLMEELTIHDLSPEFISDLYLNFLLDN